MKHQEIIQESIELGKKEILNDVMRGVVPTDVADFGELHDYVDANMYGHTESIEKLFEKNDEPTDSQDREVIQVFAKVQDVLSSWISTGQMEIELNQLQTK
jgi:hypothetical protein